MRKTNFTFLTQQLRNLLVLLMLVGINASIDAQCALVCNGAINVSLDGAGCDATLAAVDLLNGEETTCVGGQYTVHILDHHGNFINDTGVIGFEHVGQTLQYKVVEASGNSCWGYVKVEDKYDPVIVCEPVPGPFYCYDLIDFTPEIVADCDGDDVAIDLINEIVMTNDCSAYGPDTLMKITRTYVATDLSGNQSDPCTFEFFVLRLPNYTPNMGWADVDCPTSLLKATKTALQCDGTFPLDKNGNPSPIPSGMYPGTGVPVYVTPDSTYALYPNPDQFCNLLVDYTDQVLSDDGCVIKIMRRWTIIEWSCESPQRTMECFQVIEIVDEVGPNVIAPADFRASTNDHQCAADVYVSGAQVSDNCSDEITVDLAWTGGKSGFIPDFNGGFVPLDTGLNVLTFTAYDECGNSSTDVTEILVEDKTPPVAICDQFTVASLSSDGVAWVHASVFDDGSYDECKLDRMEVRRMDGDYCDEDGDGIIDADGDGIVDPDDFDEYVKFCCDDVGRTDIMVVFRVWDKAGNYNDCMVSIEIQDKLPPLIVCPPDLTVECGIDYADLDIFGTVQMDKADVEPIVISPDYLISWNGGIGALTDGYAEDNCTVSVTMTSVDTINQCNLGRIYRTFTATDAGGRTAVCTQRIDIINTNPFVEDDITWPLDTLMTGCSDPTSGEFHPDNMGYPTFDEDECDLIGTSYEDHIFPFNNSEGDACFKILRKWKVIDWCQFRENTSTNGNHSNQTYEYWHWTQVIKVNNTINPSILGDYPRVEVCTYDPTCTDGFIELNANATDDCTAALKASWKIDAFNDGSFDIFSENVLGTVIGNSISASGTYPIGSHRIEWTFIDFCGNKTTIDQLFDIVNCKAPTPYCINGLAVDLMPMDFDRDGTIDGGMVELWASDFDAGSYHTCDDYVVHLSFTPDTADRSMIFDCSMVGEQQVRIYASIITPMDSIIQSFCITTLDVQDNMRACSGGTPPRAVVSGAVSTEDTKQIEEVSVALLGSELVDQMTNTTGQYAFADMPVGGAYEVVPTKTDNPTNGVSTLDLVFIQRHILGISTFESPYKLIAADINDDGKISASDILELRKLILGVDDNFNNNSSWRFVDAGHTFENAQDALDFEFPESYDIPSLDNNMVVNFTGVKIGDVNDNAKTSRLDRNTTTRSAQSFNMMVENTSFEKGDRLSIDVTAQNVSALVGMQATLSLDPNKVQVIGVTGQSLNITDANVNLRNNEEGLLTLSWNVSEAININAGEVLFTLEVEATDAGSLNSSMTILDNPLTAEAYNNTQDVLGLNLQFNNIEEGEFTLLQNTPNPFNQMTEIGFVLPEDMNVTLTVFDVTGKTISRVNRNFNAGNNSIRLTKSELNATGVLYYQLEAGQYTATKKMVILR